MFTTRCPWDNCLEISLDSSDTECCFNGIRASYDLSNGRCDAEERVAGECLLNEWLGFHQKGDSFSSAVVCPVFLAISFVSWKMVFGNYFRFSNSQFFTVSYVDNFNIIIN